MSGIPNLSAASALEPKPPASPDSLVTTQSTYQADQRAMFKSAENGPCIAQICDRGTPVLSASSKEPVSRVIRNHHSRCSAPDCFKNASTSLIPVAKKIR